MSSNSPSGGIKDMVLSFSNLNIVYKIFKIVDRGFANENKIDMNLSPIGSQAKVSSNTNISLTILRIRGQFK